MIDLVKNTRKTDVDKLWDILGDKWLKVKLNQNSKNVIESFWNTNDLLSNGRINSLVNGTNRLSQFNIYGVQDFYFIDFQSLIKNSKNDDFIYEYKLFYKDFNDNTGKKVNYIYPPKVLSNTILAPVYTDSLYTGTIHYIKKTEKKIVLLLDGKIENNDNSFKGYIFLDEKNIPFRIKNKIDNTIYYEEIFENTSPSVNSITIKNKFELFLNEDFLVEEFGHFLKFRFKKFDELISFNESQNFFEIKNTLFIPNIFYLDNFNLENFGYPIGLKDGHISSLLNSGDSYADVNNKIYKFWKLNQRPFNFKQCYRIANLIADLASAKTLDAPEVLFEINKPERIYKTAKLSAKVFGRILSYNLLPSSVKDIYSGTSEVFNIIELQNSNVFGLKFNDIFIINGDKYLVKRIYENNYVQLDKEITARNIYEEIKILDGASIREYKLNNYGFYDQFNYQTVDDINTNFADTIPARTIPFGVKNWGSFLWGEKYYEIIHPITKLKKTEVGKEYFHGDPIEQSVLLNYYPEKISTYYIQKQLAIENKEFNLSEFETYYFQKNYLLLPFTNYSYKFDFNENNLTSGWTIDSDTDVIYSEVTPYRMAYSSINAESAGKRVYKTVNLGTNNFTKKSVLKLYVRGNSGAFKIGLTDGSSFLNPGSFKTVSTDIDSDGKWKEIFLFVDTNINGSGTVKILIESSAEINKLDIFGLEFYNSVPDYMEKIHLNKLIFTDFLKSNDFRLINLL